MKDEELSAKPPRELGEMIDQLRPWWPQAWKDEIVQEVRGRLPSPDLPARDLERAARDALVDEIRKRREGDTECLRRRFEKLMACLLPSRQEELREDLVQEAVIRLLKSMDRHGHDRGISWAFLWRVARSVVIDELGRRGTREGKGVSIDEIETAEPLPSPDPDPAALVLAGELGNAIRRCLGGLTPDERRVMSLSLVDEESKAREIAAILGWPSKKVHNQLYTGRQKLRECLETAGYRRDPARRRRRS